jgi:CHASE1-domain containing sensor protein
MRCCNSKAQSECEDMVDIQDFSETEMAPNHKANKGTGSISLVSFKLQNIPVVTALILCLGIVTSGAFLSMGITSAQRVQNEQFQRSATDLTKKLQAAWKDYVNAASMIHMRCRGRNFTREDFRDMYEYMVAGGLRFRAAQFDPNITHAERPAAEEEARQFYKKYYPSLNYRGFVGLATPNATNVTVRPQADFYFPVHYMEPVEGNERAIDLDYHASGSRKKTVDFCIREGRPGLTDRLKLVQETIEIAYGVVLMHPGYKLNDTGTGGVQDMWPKDLASVVVRIPDLLQRSAEDQGEGADVYLYDKSDSSGKTIFLGAASIKPRKGSIAQLTPIPEIGLADLQKSGVFSRLSDIDAANKIWTVVVVRQEGSFQPAITFVVTGGVLIICAAVSLSIWVYCNMRRIAHYNRQRLEGEAEKSALILASAQESARIERELNDFIAHE